MLLSFPGGRAEGLLLASSLWFVAGAAGFFAAAEQRVGDLQAGVAFAIFRDRDHALVGTVKTELVALAVVGEHHAVSLRATGDLGTGADRLGADVHQPFDVVHPGIDLRVLVGCGKRVPAGGQVAEEEGEGQAVRELHRFSLDQGCLVDSKHSLFFHFCQY